MNSRKLKKEAVGTTKYFLDIQDVFENLHKVYYDEEKSKDKRGTGGASVDEVFQYAIDLGLVVTTRCRSPIMKNLYSHCCECVRIYGRQYIYFVHLYKNDIFYIITAT